MIVKLASCAVVGLSARSVVVEVDVASQGLPSFTIVGLPSKSVEESKERVRSALKNSGFSFPVRRITVNLAPSTIPKEGSSYDLAIAVGVLAASGQIAAPSSDLVFCGELSLDGGLRRVTGMLPVALWSKENDKVLVLPQGNVKEVSLVSGCRLLAFESLKDLVLHLTGMKKCDVTVMSHDGFLNSSDYEFDMKDVRGQETVRRVMEIAAAGGHNVLLSGVPGAGKTLLARTLPSIMPALTLSEAVEVSSIYSVTGLLSEEEPFVRRRPFRSPHHSTSHIGLVGGGSKPKPGEVSLAHRGVLFLDEVAEFTSQALEGLRQPLEDGRILVSRASGSFYFPARFLLVGAMNPCPCGYFGDSRKRCTCTFNEVRSYQKKLSGPFLDRIDLFVSVAPVETSALTRESLGESSASVRGRVQRARDAQTRRFSGDGIYTNAEMSNKDVKNFCDVSGEGMRLLEQAVERFGLSARASFRVLKVGRTIADLEGSDTVSPAHVAEALQYRKQD